MEYGYHLFSIGIGSECYTIVLQDHKDDAEKNLQQYFDRVKYLQTQKEKRRDWHGNRPLGKGIIRACYFSGLFSPKRSRPLVEPEDALA